MNQNETTSTQKLAIAGVLTAAAVAGTDQRPGCRKQVRPCPAHGQCICRRHPRSVVGCRNRILRKPDS